MKSRIFCAALYGQLCSIFRPTKHCASVRGIMALATVSKNVAHLRRVRCFSSVPTVHKTLRVMNRPDSLSIVKLGTYQNNSAQKSSSGSVLCIQEKMSALALSSPILPKQEYRLPTTWYNGVLKRSIIDPVFSNVTFDLPTATNLEIEKLDPSLQSIFPIIDPSPLQRIVDQGAPPITKETQPHLMTIRHKKMKKHQLRKLRKRMRFLRRKLEAVKRKKKEKVMLDYERRMATWSKEFDPDKYVEDHLMRARAAGWEIDIVAERGKKKGTVGVNVANSPVDK